MDNKEIWRDFRETQLKSNYQYIDTLQQEDSLYCYKCNEYIKEQDDCEWQYYDLETKAFECPKCKTKHEIQINIEIMKEVFIWKEVENESNKQNND